MKKLSSKIKLKAREYNYSYKKTIIFIWVIILWLALAIYLKEGQIINFFLIFVWPFYFFYRELGLKKWTPESIFDTNNNTFTLNLIDGRSINIHINEIKDIYIELHWIVLKIAENQRFYMIPLQKLGWRNPILYMIDIVNHVRKSPWYFWKNTDYISKKDYYRSRSNEDWD